MEKSGDTDMLASIVLGASALGKAFTEGNQEMLTKSSQEKTINSVSNFAMRNTIRETLLLEHKDDSVSLDLIP